MGGGGWDCGTVTIFEGTGSMDFLTDIKIKLSTKLYSPYKIGKSVGFFPSERFSGLLSQQSESNNNYSQVKKKYARKELSKTVKK